MVAVAILALLCAVALLLTATGVYRTLNGHWWWEYCERCLFRGRHARPDRDRP